MRHRWATVRKRFGLLGMLVVLGLGTTIFSLPAKADSPVVTQFSVPSNIQARGVYAHGDGSVTVSDNDCPTYYRDAGSTATSYSTMRTNGEISDVVAKVSENNPANTGSWQTQPCQFSIVTAADGTTYVVQVGPSPAYKYRIIATRDRAVLWTSNLVDPTSCGRNTQAATMALGKDGNLYVGMIWQYKSSSCPELDGLLSINTTDGAQRWSASIPDNNLNGLSRVSPFVMPYADGVAIRSASNVYYFTYGGGQLTSQTFNPVLNGATVENAKIVPDTGRAYLTTSKYNGATNSYDRHLYYKDTSSSTITEVALQTSAAFYPTPGGGVVEYYRLNSVPYFSYYDANGSLVYQQNLGTEQNASLTNYGFSIVVDSQGNVLARRVFDSYGVGGSDRNVLIDSFSPTGVKTRLFTSASLGGSGFDAYMSTTDLLESLGNGYLYMVLCHSTSSYITSCSSGVDANFKVLQIAVGNQASDYPRAYAFAASGASPEYVALGDSYSSGEGNASLAGSRFIPPSDADQCDRSYFSYPILVRDTNNQGPTKLRMNAFRACSGAVTDNIINTWQNGEPPQSWAVSTNTKVITMSIGGNDIGFSNFALRCITPGGSCDETSFEYQDSMARISGLGSKLATVYSTLHARGPNAKIYVVGYPYPVPSVDIPCSSDIFTDSERTAARNLVTALNQAIRDQVDAANTAAGQSYMYFVDPNRLGSPFAGHELCTDNPYFFGIALSVNDYRFSFHPNAAGQDAYAQLVNAAFNAFPYW